MTNLIFKGKGLFAVAKEHQKMINRLHGIEEKPRAPKKPDHMVTCIVYSGKGGVGKTTTTANLYKTAVARGMKVAVLDADVNTPSTNLLIQGDMVFTAHGSLPDSQILTQPVVKMWFRDCIKKMKAQKVDLLLVDMPPSISDLHISTLKIVSNPVLLMVTQPHDLSRQDNFRALKVLESVGIKSSGTLVNMAPDGYELLSGEISKVGFAGKLDSDLPFTMFRDGYESTLDYVLSMAKPSEFSETKFNESAHFDESITFDTIRSSIKSWRHAEFVNLSTWDRVREAIEDYMDGVGMFDIREDELLSWNNAERVERMVEHFKSDDRPLFMVHKPPFTNIRIFPGTILPATFGRKKSHYNLPVAMVNVPWGDEKVTLFPHEVIPADVDMIADNLHGMIPLENGGYLPSMEMLEDLEANFGRLMGFWGGWEDDYNEILKKI